MVVSAIVVTYNRIDKLKVCLGCLLKQTYGLNDIIVINNNSTDGTTRYLNKLPKNKFIIKNLNKNIGGAGGFNLGIKIAFETTHSNFFWLMDDDSMPTRKSLNSLVLSAKLLHNHFGFLCSNVRLRKNKRPCNIPNLSNDWSELLPGNLIKVNFATFVSYMISRNIVSKVGLPIRQMFIWGDDYEYSLRISHYEPCYFVSNSIVLHNSMTYSSKNSIFNMSPGRDVFIKCSVRNSLYAIRKHKRFRDVIKIVLNNFYVICKIPFIAKRTRLRKMWYIFIGMIEGFFFNPKIDFPKDNTHYN